MPTREAGAALIRLVRRRWPQVPLAAVLDHPDDLAELHGTAECPVLILTKPVQARHVEEILRLALPPHPLPLSRRGTFLSHLSFVQTGERQG
jgi:hypothetical protein